MKLEDCHFAVDAAPASSPVSVSDHPAEPSKSIMDRVKGKLPIDNSYLSQIENLKTVRPVVIKCPHLLADCKDFDQALLIAAAAEVMGASRPVAAVVANDLAEAGITTFGQFCDLLTEVTGGAVVVLDDFFALIDRDQKEGERFGGSGSTEAIFRDLHHLVHVELRNAGTIIAVTGRSPTSAFRILGEGFISPVFVKTIMLDALSLKDIINILHRTKAPADLRLELGLAEDRDMQVLATCLHHYTGGYGRVVEHAIKALAEDKTLQLRGSKHIEEVLTKEFMEAIYHKLPDTLLPTISRCAPSWDKTQTFLSLLDIFHKAETRQAILARDFAAVGPSESVHTLDLLSFFGVPFKVAGRLNTELQVPVFPWLVRSLADSTFSMREEILMTSKLPKHLVRAFLDSPQGAVAWDEILENAISKDFESSIVSCALQHC